MLWKERLSWKRELLKVDSSTIASYNMLRGYKAPENKMDDM